MIKPDSCHKGLRWNPPVVPPSPQPAPDPTPTQKVHPKEENHLQKAGD